MLNDPALPASDTVTVNPSSVFNGSNKYTFTGYASFLQLDNTSPSLTVNVMFNGLSTAIWSLAPGVQTFNPGDIYIKSIDFAQPLPSVSPVSVQWIAGVKQG